MPGQFMLAQATFLGPSVEWWHLSPVIALLGGALFLLVAGALTPRWPRGLYALVTVVTTGLAGLFAVLQWRAIDDDGTELLVGGVLAFDQLTQFLTIAICAATLLVALVTADDLHRTGNDGPEVYALLLVAATGAIVMASANELILMFLGLETMSLAFYVLAASDRERSTSREAGLKYFILGGVASAFFLYGVALVYGGAQSTNISGIVAAFQANVALDANDAIVLAGVALLVVGLAFKVSAVPFHVWTPDVYEGAPTNVTAFMASVGKIAAFGAMLRVLVVALPFQRDDWRPVIWVLAVLTLVIGSVLAVVQTDVKRMLAYSAISHAGFILVGIEAAGHRAGEYAALGNGIPSVATYLALYSVLTVGSFAVVTLVGRANGGDTSLEAFRGFAKRRPAVALALTVFLLAQAGVPLTSGFVAKWAVIQAAVEEESYAIAIIAMVAAVIAAFLYLRIMVSMWLQDSPDGVEREPVPAYTGVAVLVAVLITIGAGVWPEWILDAADHVAQYAR